MDAKTNKNQFKSAADGAKNNINAARSMVNQLPGEQQKQFSGILDKAQEAFANKDVGKLTSLFNDVMKIADGSQVSK